MHHERRAVAAEERLLRSDNFYANIVKRSVLLEARVEAQQQQLETVTALIRSSLESTKNEEMAMQKHLQQLADKHNAVVAQANAAAVQHQHDAAQIETWYNTTLDKIKIDRARSIAQLHRETEAAKTRAVEKERFALRLEHRTQLKELKAQHAQQVKQMHMDNDTTNNAAAIDQKNSAISVIEEKNKRTNAKELLHHQKEMQNMKEHCQQEVAQIQTKNQAQTAALATTVKQEKNAIRRQHEKEMKDLVDQHRQHVAQIQRDNEQKIIKLKEYAVTKVQQVKLAVQATTNTIHVEHRQELNLVKSTQAISNKSATSSIEPKVGTIAATVAHPLPSDHDEKETQEKLKALHEKPNDLLGYFETLNQMVDMLNSGKWMLMKETCPITQFPLLLSTDRAATPFIVWSVQLQCQVVTTAAVEGVQWFKRLSPSAPAPAPLAAEDTSTNTTNATSNTTNNTNNNNNNNNNNRISNNNCNNCSVLSNKTIFANRTMNNRIMSCHWVWIFSTPRIWCKKGC